MSGSGVFVEDPWTRIVGGRKKKKPPEPPDRSPPYCGRYGFGSIVIDLGGIPYGPNQFAPMIGTFWTNQMNFVGDLQVGGLSPAILAPPTLNAGPYGIYAANMYLSSSNLSFTTNQLYFGLPDPNGRYGVYRWVVPMVGGQDADGIPRVIKSYIINVDFAGRALAGDYDAFGIGISHPLPTVSVAEPVQINPPPVPAAIVSPGDTYIYDFQYERWANNESRVDEGNQFDPNLGGPAVLWWMAQPHGSSGWLRAQNVFMATNILIGVGDWYTWEVIAECQAMPNFNPHA
jgi:hypothetical protein